MLLRLVSRTGWPASCHGGGDLPGPGPAFGEAEPQAPAAAGRGGRLRRRCAGTPFRLPAAGVAGECEHLRPGEQFAGQGDDLAPDLVLGEAFQRQVPQPSVLRAADPVLASGPLLMP